MAQENIKETKPLFKYSIGARYLVIGEAVFPKKYKTKGCEFTVKQLEELGLPEGIVDYGVVLNAPKTAESTEQAITQFFVVKPGFEEGVQKVKIQAYEGITTKANKELAAESEEYKEMAMTVMVIGK